MNEDAIQKSVEDFLKPEEKTLFKILLEGALVCPFGTECCDLEDFSDG